MKPLHSTHVVTADYTWLADKGAVSIPGAGRVQAGITASNLDTVIYSVTLAVNGALSADTYGFQIFGKGGDGVPLFRAFDTFPAETGSSIHVTFPNGFLCRSAKDVGILVDQDYGGSVFANDRPIPIPSSNTVATDVLYCPSVAVTFPGVQPSEAYLTVTYGYVPQVEMQP